MSGLLKKLHKGNILFFDGAMGTQLMESGGLQLGECPELWNINPKKKIIADIHRQYLRAGCDIIETNTFGANGIRLGIFKLEGKIYEINKAAAKNARSVCGKQKFVGGSIGPTGIFLKRKNKRCEKEIMDAYLPQICGLADGCVDVLCVETMMDMNETRCIVKAIQNVTRTIPVSVTMTFMQTKNGFRTPEGLTPERAAEELCKMDIAVAGTNCNLDVKEMIEILRRMKKHTSLPLAAQPTAGQPVLIGQKIMYPYTPDLMAEHVSRLMDAGAQLIGGCCGTTPSHIRKMIEAARKHVKIKSQKH